MSTWKYMQNGQQLGPVDTTALLALLRSGTLTPDTTVCKEGTANWAPIRTVPELSSQAPGNAPPLSVPPTSSAATPLADGETPDPADVDKNKIFAVLAYLGILFLVPLLAAKESRFARYHTNQGVVLFLSAIVAYMAVFFLTLVIAFIPFLRWLGCLLWWPVTICVFVFMIMGIINAAKGDCKPLPVIGQFKLIK
jgi:uncharacterized membrane protein